MLLSLRDRTKPWKETKRAKSSRRRSPQGRKLRSRKACVLSAIVEEDENPANMSKALAQMLVDLPTLDVTHPGQQTKESRQHYQPNLNALHELGLCELCRIDCAKCAPKEDIRRKAVIDVDYILGMEVDAMLHQARLNARKELNNLAKDLRELQFGGYDYI